MDIVLIAIGGVLLGGSWSLSRQRAPAWLVTLVAVAGTLCLVVAVAAA